MPGFDDVIAAETVLSDVDGANGSVTVEPAEAGRVSVCVDADDLKALPGVLARVRRVFVPRWRHV